MEFASSEVLNSYNYAIKCDHIYAGMFTEEQIERLEIESLDKTPYNTEYSLIRNKNFILKENDSIFCSLDLIDELFYMLSKVKNLKNIKLLTHQSDKSISKQMFEKKPDCISLWLGINVDFVHDKLIPIPIGLANNHPKNIQFNNLIFMEDLKKTSKLYLNFNENTNYKHRSELFEKFSKFEWVFTDNPELPIDEYAEKIKKHNFVLCPWGNGIDTHRFWETIYLGSIPITVKHYTYNAADSLPHILVDSYDEIIPDQLQKYLDNKQQYNYEKLKVNYWIGLMKSNIVSNNTFTVNNNKFISAAFKVKYSFNKSVFSKHKIVKYYLKKIKERLTG